LLALTACDPPPPRASFTVNSSTTGSDANLGDGVCEATPGADDCGLQAAIDEGNALGAADIHLPSGVHAAGSDDVHIRGSLKLIGVGPDVVLSVGRLVVDSGGDLLVQGTTGSPQFHTDGLLILRKVHAGFDQPVLTIGPEGRAIVESSILYSAARFYRTVDNRGALIVHQSSLIGVGGGAPLDTRAGGTTWLASTLVVGYPHPLIPSSSTTSCLGEAPLSGGYNAAATNACQLTGEGDQNAVGIPFEPEEAFPLAAIPLASSSVVDAIPHGVNGCGTTVTTDNYGNPRPVDGNGGGVVGCDIGAVERQGADGGDQLSAAAQ
jgi:hypothetical protein